MNLSFLLNAALRAVMVLPACASSSPAQEATVPDIPQLLKERGGVPISEIREMHSQCFLGSGGKSGRMDLEGFHALWKRSRAQSPYRVQARSTPSPEVVQKVDAMVRTAENKQFKQMDKDLDGSLTRDEFLDGTMAYYYQRDKDKDGIFTMKELLSESKLQDVKRDMANLKEVVKELNETGHNLAAQSETAARSLEAAAEGQEEIQ